MIVLRTEGNVLLGVEMEGGGKRGREAAKREKGLLEEVRGCDRIREGRGEGKGIGSSKEVGTITQASLPVAPTRPLIL